MVSSSDPRVGTASGADIALTRLMQTLDGGNKEMIMGILLEKLRFVLDRLQGPAQPINIADHIRLISLRYPELFISGEPLEYLIQVLKTSSYGSKPSKTAAPSSSTASAPNLLPLMAVEIFFRVFESRATWPVEVVDAYLDDAIHFRMWVDASESRPFLLQLHQRINDVEDKEKEEVSLREYLVRSLRRIVLEINSTSKQSKVTTFSLIETLTTFVSVPEIRAELPVLIDKWSTNPAFATSVKRLLEKLATSLQSTSSNSLFLTDGPVLQTLIRSRQYLKTEEFRAILQVLLLGNIEVAIETSKYFFLSDDSLCKAFKPETVKLFISILSSSTNSSYDLTTFLTAFFQAVLQICLPFFSSVQSKTITELFMRLLRFLPSQQIQVLRFFSDTQLQLQTFCVFESDITKMYLDMSSSMVLSLVHDVIGIEKELLGITKPPNASAVRNIPVLPKKPSSSLFISKSNPVVKSGRTSNPAMEISKDEGKKLDVVGLTADKEGLLERISNLQIICLSFLMDILKNSCTAPASGAYAVDTVSKILGMNLNYYNKLNVESAYPNSSLYLKENGVVALDSILYSARIFKYACGCIEDLTAGIDVIETLLLKGLRNKIKFGTHNSAVEVVSTLLSLAHVVILTPDEYANIDTSTLPCVSSFLTKEEEASSSGSYSPEISVPPMAIRSLYWRTHLFLAALACNVPNILGDYVWQYLPSVRVLLSMTISNKFNTSQLTPQTLSTIQIPSNSTSSFSHQNVSLFFSSKGVEVITKGDVKHMEETLMEGESQLWDALFLFGFPFRGQLSSSSGSLSKEKEKDGEKKAEGLQASEEFGVKRKRFSIVLSEPILDESKGLEKEERFTRPSRKQRRIEDDDDGEEEEEESSTVPKFPKALKDFTFLPPSVSQRGRVRKPTEIMRQNWLQNRQQDEDYIEDDNEVEEESDDDRNSKRRISKRKSSTRVAPSLSTMKRKLESKNAYFKVTREARGEIGARTSSLGPIPKEELMFLIVEKTYRVPPSSTIQTLMTWNDTFKLGDALRRCTEPDFISRAVAKEGVITRAAVEESSSWLLPAIALDTTSVLTRLSPLAAVSHLLLSAVLKILKRFDSFGSCSSGEVITTLLGRTDDFNLDAKLLLALVEKVFKSLMFSKDDKKVARNEVIDMLTVVVTAMGGDRNTRRAFRLITFLMGLLNEDESRQLDLPALFEGIQRQGADMIVWVSVCQVSEDYKGVVLTSLLQLGLKAETDETAIWAYLQLLSSLGSKETITIAFEVLCISRTQLLRNILQKESQIKSLFLSVFSQLQLYISQNIPFGTFIVVETLPDSSFYIPIKEGICIHLKVIGMILTAVSFSLVEEDSMTSLLLSIIEQSSTDRLQHPLLLNSYHALLGAMDTTVLEILASKLPLLFLLKLLVSNIDTVSPPVLLFCLTLLDSCTENIVEVLSPTEAQILLEYTSFHFSELPRTSKFLTLLETLSTKPVEDLVPMELKEEERVATLTSPILPIKWNTVSEILAACESILQSSIEVSIYPYLNIIVQEESIEKRGWLTETVASFISVKNLNLELLKFLLSYDVSLLPNNELHILWKSVLKSDPLPLLQLAIGLSPDISNPVYYLFLFFFLLQSGPTSIDWLPFLPHFLTTILSIHSADVIEEEEFIFSSNKIVSNLRFLLISCLQSDERCMELTLDFVQFQILKRKNKSQITSFGFSFFRQICFSLYLFRPEILSSIMDTKSFFRFISTEVFEDIVSSFEEEKREEKGIGKDETLKKEDFLLSSELSPWIHNFAYSKMDNLISLAIEVISDSKCSLFHANEKEKAVQFLVKVSGKHPLLFIRHFPVFVCRIATYLFRRKGGDFYTVRRKNILTMYERNKDEAKEMEGEEEDKEREEEMVSFTATGMKGEGSSCKVFFNVTSSHVFVENLLWKTLIKCLKKANIRSLNQEVEEAVKKLAASSCIQF